MNTFTLTIATPDGSRFQDEVIGLFVRGAEGDLAILAGHMPFITSVVKCECLVSLPDGQTRTATTDGGLLTVSKDEVTFVSGSFKFKD